MYRQIERVYQSLIWPDSQSINVYFKLSTIIACTIWRKCKIYAKHTLHLYAYRSLNKSNFSICLLESKPIIFISLAGQINKIPRESWSCTVRIDSLFNVIIRIIFKRTELIYFILVKWNTKTVGRIEYEHRAVCSVELSSFSINA